MDGVTILSQRDISTGVLKRRRLPEMNESNEQRVIRIMESFEASLKPLGIEVCGKDLLEILSEMATVIAELKNEVFDL